MPIRNQSEHDLQIDVLIIEYETNYHIKEMYDDSLYKTIIVLTCIVKAVYKPHYRKYESTHLSVLNTN